MWLTIIVFPIQLVELGIIDVALNSDAWLMTEYFVMESWTKLFSLLSAIVSDSYLLNSPR